MQNVKSIELVFENCEYVTIPSEFIGTLELDGIRQHISRVASNCISKMTAIKNVAIEIFKNADGEHSPFGMESEKTTIFGRITSCDDITSIIVNYDDESSETLYVDYEEEYEGVLGAENKLQTTKTNKFGDVYIVISKQHSFEDYFDEEEINNEDLNSFHKSMITPYNGK